MLSAEAPLVGTGMEGVVARDSGAAIMAKRAGIIDQVDAQRIVIRATDDLELGDAGLIYIVSESFRDQTRIPVLISAH